MHFSRKPNLRDEPIVKYHICNRRDKEHAYSSYHEQQSSQVGFLCLFRNKRAKGRYQRVLEVTGPSAVVSVKCEAMAYRRPEGKRTAILPILVCRIIELRHVGDQAWCGFEEEWDRVIEEMFYRRDPTASTSPEALQLASPQTVFEGLPEANVQPLRSIILCLYSFSLTCIRTEYAVCVSQ